MNHLLKCNVSDMRNDLNKGKYTSYDLVKFYLSRIIALDKSGPSLNSVLEINPDAIYIAQAMDRERSLGKERSYLHGIPILIKDNINTHDKMHTSAGSLALADNLATYDATIIKKLRQAGLVILGKVNMTEMANFMAYNMKNGYSSRGGQVVNPYNPQGDTWGSSSGSAVAMAANLATLSIGTETDGSIIWPSNNNSVVGLKPSRGLVSRHGIIPICTAQDIAGPITRNVTDAAYLLNVLVGEDEHDPSTWCQQGHIPSNYADYLTMDGVKGKRVGFNIGYQNEYTEDQRALSDKAREVFIKEGAELIECNLPHQRSDHNVLLYEMKPCLNAYLSTTSYSNQCRSLKEIIDFNRSFPDQCLKYGQGLLEDAEALSGTLTEQEYIETRYKALEGAGPDGIMKIMDDYQLDYIISPGISDTSPISGYPSITVPLGYDRENMPFGLTFISKMYDEPTLIKAAFTFEQITHFQKLPPFDL